MSDKAECPRCDSYVSEVNYDGRHTFCGWNCCVEWVTTAYGEAGHAELVATVKPSEEARSLIAQLAGASSADVSVRVDGQTPREPLSPWLDPDKPSPPDISPAGRRNQRRAEKKAALMAEAERRIEDELGLR